MANIVSAVFDNDADAQRAVDWLRNQGAPDNAISVARRHEEDREYGYKGGAATLERPAEAGYGTEDAIRLQRKDTDVSTGAKPGIASDVGEGAAIGAGTGAVAGALWGLAAAFIPGVGPLITAGALASTLGAVGGGIVAGGIVGGVAGGLGGALAAWGVEAKEAEHYAGEVEKGATYVGVDLDKTTLTRPVVEDAFERFHGRMYSGA